MCKLAVLFFGLLPALSIANGSCEADHWVKSVTGDGSIIVLEDGSIWEVASYDRATASAWLATINIVVCDDKLVDTDDDESVDATRIK